MFSKDTVCKVLNLKHAHLRLMQCTYHFRNLPRKPDDGKYQQKACKDVQTNPFLQNKILKIRSTTTLLEATSLAEEEKKEEKHWRRHR